MFSIPRRGRLCQLQPVAIVAGAGGRGQSDWLTLLCRTLSFLIPSRFIPALSLTPIAPDCPQYPQDRTVILGKLEKLLVGLLVSACYGGNGVL